MKIEKKPSNLFDENHNLGTGEEEQKISSRRHFLKKAVYATPVFMAMGQLVKPTNAQAADSVPPPPPDF